MAKYLTMISGKGGSGKTSFSLAYAKVLAKSGIKVLVVDCDMSTHGATFFMKPLIENHRKSVNKIISVEDIIMAAKMPAYGFYTSNVLDDLTTGLEKLVPVEDNFYFLPSNISISNKYKAGQITYFETFHSCIKEELEKHFDVIIFDCQAGYSDFTRFLTTMSNISILVTLPDPVSAAANRALVFQIGKELEGVQSYQAFNQVTAEEAVSYEKITTSALFMHLSPTIYSLDVRQAFMRLQIPAYNTCTDFDFNKKILTTLFTLFPEYSNQLEEYRRELYAITISKYENKIQKIKRENKKRNKSNIISMIEYMLIGLSMLVSISSVMMKDLSYELFFSENKVTILYLIIIFLLSIGAMCFSLLKKTYNLTTDNTELLRLENELLELKYKS